ncbi:MAG: hypothetical protein ACFE0J_09045 [Elainellaceae cyanobacterium]
MRFRIFVVSTFSLVALSLPTLAETAPPIAFDTQLDPTTGERSVVQIVLERGGEVRTYRLVQLIRPVIEAYAQAPAGIPVAFGTPAPIDTPTGLQQDTGAELPSTPSGENRTTLLTDDFINSALLNIAEDRPGLILHFPEALQNAPGPDLVLAELSLPRGGQSNACPGTPAPGADRFNISHPEGQSLTIPSEALGEFGPAGVIANHGAANLAQQGARLASLDELQHGVFEPLAAVSYFRIWAVAVDLSDLGIPDGESIERLELRSAGILTETESGTRNCWLIDPAFVMGLPAE